MAKGDLEKVTIRLHAGDKDKLNDYYPHVGYNVVIRELVRNFIRKIEEKTSRQSEEHNININMEELDDDISTTHHGS